MADAKNIPPGPPPPPPLLPPSVNEEVFAPKRKMQVVREAARQRLKKHHRKFEKLVRKYLKKIGEKARYCQFYDLGYRYEAVFCELTMDGMDLLGAPLSRAQGGELLAFVQDGLRLPGGEEAILLQQECDESAGLTVLKLVAEAEFKEIERLREQVEHAPRAGNPGQ